MTTNDIAQRNDKSIKLRAFQVMAGEYYVESAEGKICYRVYVGNGTKSCSCGDFTSRNAKDPTFLCKHILAVIHGNGNIRSLDLSRQKPRLDERFIKSIDGKDFALYSGLLDLAHQNHLLGIEVELLQYPGKDNEYTAVCKATIKTAEAGPYIDYGDANPANCNSKVAKHLIRMASTRAKARALRDMTNVGMTALEELGDFNDVAEEDSGRTKTRTRRDNKSEHQPTVSTHQAPPKQELQKGATDDGRNKKAESAKKEAAPASETAGKAGNTGAKPVGAQDKKIANPPAAKAEAKPSEAQIKAIEKLAERRGINGQQLVTIFTDRFHKSYTEINADEAKRFITHLQQAA